MLSLLNNLDKLKSQKHYQEFIIEIGISKYTVLIPLKESDDFETQAKKQRPLTTQALKTLVESFSGTVEE